MSQNEMPQNKMAVKPIGKLMLTMAIPMILSMMLQALYNIVDSAFVSNMSGEIGGLPIGDAATNALTLAFPVQMLMVAVAIGTGVGANALLSKSLGEGDRETASRTAGNSIFLGAIIFVVFLLFGCFAVPLYVGTQTDNQVIADMAIDYLKICSIVSFGIVFFSIFEKLLQATGRTLFSTIAQVAGALVNIVLDPIMIYGLLGCPEMGVQGAAYATVIGQIVSLILALVFHFTLNKELKKSLSYLKPSGRLIRRIYAIGLPAIIAQALMSFMTYGMNIILVTIDEAYVTAYGIYYKIQQFILFAAFGLRDAITPIVSFNYGMKSGKRVKEGIRYGMIDTLVIMVIGLVALEALAEPLAGVFHLAGATADGSITTQALCVEAMRIIAPSFLFAGANVAYQGIFQAVDCGMESLIVSVCRQLLFVLPVAWLFSVAVNAGGGHWLVWMTFLISEIVSAVIAFFLMRRINKKKIAALPDEPSAEPAAAA